MKKNNLGGHIGADPNFTHTSHAGHTVKVHEDGTVEVG